MLLAELCDQLLPLWKPSRQKDVKSAVLYLAKALDCPDPQHCSPELYDQPLPTLYRRIEDYQRAQSKSPHIIRNTKNVISRLFRLAEQQHLLSLISHPLTVRFPLALKPARPGAVVAQNTGTYLPYTHWPAELQSAFTVFETWATAPVMPGREAHLRKRAVTIRIYRGMLQSYYGFLAHVQQLSPLTFEHLFDYDLVSAFVHWHINERHHRVTIAIHTFLQFLLALTRQYRPNPALRARLATLKKTLPIPPPTYSKDDAWVSLATLDEIGKSIWPRKQPKDLRRQKGQHTGTCHAQHAAIALMLRLWCYRPYRQRNMREMQLGDNLHKDAQGKWRITFRSAELKVATKRGRPNVFDLPFPETLVPLLEEYLTMWRPILLGKASQPSSHVFLNRYGAPYERNVLAKTTKLIVYRYTGKDWHPHIVRTVWASEWIRKTHGDFYTAAIMLNDSLDMVLKKYAHLLEEDVAEKADRLLEERMGQGK